jgi:hypothetical protein
MKKIDEAELLDRLDVAIAALEQLLAGIRPAPPRAARFSARTIRQ